MIKNIIFDFDGVLVDSEVLVAKSFCRYLSKRNIKFDEKELAKSLSTQRRAEYVFENWLEHKQTRTLAFSSSIKHCDYMDNFFQAL